jgi:hypothetical protein
MIEHLQIKIKNLSDEARSIMEHERHHLVNGRTLLGVYETKHNLDAAQPLLRIKGFKYSDVPEKAALQFEKQQRALDLDNPDVLAKRDYDLYWGLHHHRINVVRKEARDSLVALAFLKGRKYDEVEAIRYSHPRWANVERIVLSFGLDEASWNGVSEQEVRQRFAEWMDDAKSVKPKNWNEKQ